jgi:hypothetical protein
METSLLARLERAERNARVIGAAVVIVAACFTWFLTTAASSSKLVTHTLSIVDSSGHERMVLSTKDGLPYIHLMDGDKKTRVSLYLYGDGERGGINIYNSNKKAVAELFEPNDVPGAMMMVNDETGSRRASMGISKEGTPALWFYAPDGKTVQAAMFISPYGPDLRLSDRSGQQRTFLGAYTDGSYGMSFYDSSGEQQWKRP